jgi:hypothetical protein
MIGLEMDDEDKLKYSIGHKKSDIAKNGCSFSPIFSDGLKSRLWFFTDCIILIGQLPT